MRPFCLLVSPSSHFSLGESLKPPARSVPHPSGALLILSDWKWGRKSHPPEDWKVKWGEPPVSRTVKVRGPGLRVSFAEEGGRGVWRRVRTGREWDTRCRRARVDGESRTRQGEAFLHGLSLVTLGDLSLYLSMFGLKEGSRHPHFALYVSRTVGISLQWEEQRSIPISGKGLPDVTPARNK